jgi:bacteriorhodopsin
VWFGEVANIARNASPAVQSAVKSLGWFVLVGWAIYPVGYIAGTAGGLFGIPMFQGLSMDVVYNIGDAINKIGFGLVIYALAQTDKSTSNA